MLRFQEIINFQSHENTILKFHKGVNVIVGSSDSGKTAILRSLLWVIENRPLGIAHISNWVKSQKKSGKITLNEQCAVSVGFDDKSVIVRLRSETENMYTIYNSEGAATVQLDAPKTGVPDEITEHINLSAVNIGRQMDTPFLIGDTAGGVARFLNHVLHLDQIDTVLTQVESDKRSIAKTIEAKTSELDGIREYISEYSWIPKAEELVRSLEMIQKKSDKTKKEADDLEDSIILYKDDLKSLPAVSDWNQVEKLQERLQSIHNKKILTIDKRNNLVSSISEYRENKKKIDQFKFLKKAIELIQELNDLIQIQRETQEKYETLETSIGSMKEYQQTIQVLTTSLKEYEEQLPDVCPTCKRPLNKDEKHALTHNV